MRKIILLLLFFGSVHAEPTQHFQSGPRKVNLLELYVSQGCSNCPPAEQWVSRFQHASDLWQRVIPVVFHVDYWDGLGWQDPFSSGRYTARQQRFKRQGLIDAVYTPGFVLNGKEWRGWFVRQPAQLATTSVGKLTVTLDQSHLQASYSHPQANLLLNMTILGMGASTHVRAGENRGKTLQGDFIVLTLTPYSFNDEGSVNGRWSMPPESLLSQVKTLAVAFWVQAKESLVPLQATGGMLTIMSNRENEEG